MFGQYDWRGVPSIPPEIMLFPNWFYFNLYEMSAWTRSIVVPLSIVWATQPAIPCPPHARIDGCSATIAGMPLADGRPHGLVSWSTFFLMWDKFFADGRQGRHWIRSGPAPAGTDPPAPAGLRRPRRDLPRLANSILAMKCLGYPDTDPGWWAAPGARPPEVPA